MPEYAIKRLNFRLKEFTRNVWVSNKAGEVWYPRITEVLNYLQEIDLLSVAEGIRKCTIKLVNSEEAGALFAKYSAYNLEIELLKRISTKTKPDSGVQDFKYWAVIGTFENNKTFKSAFQNGDQDKMSSLQGSPDCCTNFFHKWGIEEKFFDLTWPMAVNTVNSPPSPLPGGGTIEGGLEEERSDPLTSSSPSPEPEGNAGMVNSDIPYLRTRHPSLSWQEDEENTIYVEPIFQCNFLLKCLGIKTVFHTPCSFNCPHTIELADKLIALGEKNGYTRQITWLREILSWPVEWSALHGIAEIKNPVVKISTNTDATAEKYTVRFKGTLYPEETVPGLVFPYLKPEKLLISDSKSFKQGLVNNPDESN